MSAGHAIDALLGLHPSLIMAEDSCVFSPPSHPQTRSLRQTDGGEDGVFILPCLLNTPPPTSNPYHNTIQQPIPLYNIPNTPTLENTHPEPGLDGHGLQRTARSCYLAPHLHQGWKRNQWCRAVVHTHIFTMTLKHNDKCLYALLCMHFYAYSCFCSVSFTQIYIKTDTHQTGLHCLDWS